MIRIHSPSSLNNQINYNIIEENEKQNIQNKKKKLINYNDYLKLKEAYSLIQETLQKTKEENEQLDTILSSYQGEISKFNDYKQKIDKSFEIIQEKYNELYNENKSLKNNYNENAKKFNEIINDLNKEIKQYQKELSEKNNEVEKLKSVKNEFKSKYEDSLRKKEIELKEKEKEIKNKELDINNRENILNKKELGLKERENKLQLEENKLQTEKKKIEEKNKKLNEEINLKEKKINIDNDKINENNILIKETIEKLKEKEITLNKELDKIKNIRNNFIQTNEINIEYKFSKRQINENNIHIIDYIDKFSIIKKINNNKKIDDKKLEIQNLNNDNNAKLNLINDALFNNYLNTVNIGYNNSPDIFNENFDEINNIDSECEPIPSFLICLQKNKQ